MPGHYPGMARLARVEALNTPHHVTQRGNQRRAVFEIENDRSVYLGLLQRHASHQGLSILGYCLMPNHVHLIVVPQKENALRIALRNTHGRYAAYLNARLSTSGHVWQGRYYSCPMDDDYLWRALRYTERNPVRAGLVNDPVEYPWSSAQVHSGWRRDEIVDLETWSGQWSEAGWREYIDAKEVERECAELRSRTHTGRPLGSAGFVGRLEQSLDRRLAPRHGGRQARDASEVAVSTGFVFPA
jgi:putative transposase